MNGQSTTILNGRIDRTKDRPPSGAPKIRMKTKRASTDSNDQKWYILEDFLLLWLDADPDQSEKDGHNQLTQFQTIVGDIKIYTQLHECLDFLITVNGTKMALIAGHTFARQIVPLVHDIPHLYAIYILSSDVSKHERWIKRWDKVQGVHTDMKTICQSLEQIVKQYHQNSIAMTFLPTNEITSIEQLEQLDTSFLYTQIFKQILLGIDYKEEFIQDFILFWRYHYLDNPSILNLIDEFTRDYDPSCSIWWYTRHDFVYQMLNLAILRSETNIIFYLSCFLKDLNRQIEKLYRQQIDYHRGQSLIVYRGQWLSILDFEKLKKAKHGMVCFNNFLLTNKTKDVALVSMENALIQNDTIGVLFKISINPSISSIPFASIDEVSYNQIKNEILFSMSSVFRIGSITEIDENSSLYQVELKLIADNDDEFRNLIALIEDETEGYTGWKQLYQIREKVTLVYDTNTYKVAFDEAVSSATEMKRYGNKLERIDVISADNQKAISYFEEALEICKRTLPSDHLNFSAIYRNIARGYKIKTEHTKSLSFLDKALEIQINILPSDHPDLAIVYNNIGVGCHNLKDYSLALKSYGMGVAIYEKILSSNHPQLAYAYDSMGAVYFDMKDYLLALTCYEKALEMKQKMIPLNQYHLATSYTNIATTYEYMKEYKRAISCHEKALEIQKEHFSSNSYEISCTYSHIATAHESIKEYTKAASTYEQLLEYAKKNFPSDHEIFTSLYRKLGYAYSAAGEHTKALSYFEKQLEINEKQYPARHPVLASDYHAIGRAYIYLEKHADALPLLEKALDIRKETLDSNDFNLANNYYDIGETYQSLKDYSKALSFKEKAVAILETIRPDHALLLTRGYFSIADLYRQTGDRSKALSYEEKALEIYEANVPPNHHNLAERYNNIAIDCRILDMHSKAKLYLEKAIKIAEKEQPMDGFLMVSLYSEAVSAYDILGEYGKARSTKKKLIELVGHNTSTPILTFVEINEHPTEKKRTEKKRTKK